MRGIVSAIALGFVAACGGGMGPGQQFDGDPLPAGASQAASDSQRQKVIDACSPPFTGPHGKGGRLSTQNCGTPVPMNGHDQTPQHWWDFAGCIVDHPHLFSDSCRTLFSQVCANGDQCICDPGEFLNGEDDQCVRARPPRCPKGWVLDHDDQSCRRIGTCDSDFECPVEHGLGKCTSHEENDPATGRCYVARCDRGYVKVGDRCLRTRT